MCMRVGMYTWSDTPCTTEIGNLEQEMEKSSINLSFRKNSLSEIEKKRKKDLKRGRQRKVERAA